MLIASLLIVLSTALFINATINFRSIIAQLLTIYLTTFADIALILHIANLFHMMNQEWIILLIAIIILSIILLLWKKIGHKNPLSIFIEIYQTLCKINIKKTFQSHPYLLLFSLSAVICYTLIAILIYLVPPNNVDSISTHMSRVAFWLQHGDYFPWDTPRKWQIIYPVNAQLQTFWSVLFTKSDKFVGFVQYFSAIFSALAIFGIARILHLSKKQALFSSIIFLSLPAVFLQASTTQNDLTITVLFIISIYFFFYGINFKKKNAYMLSGIAIGLAVGTKQTFVFLLPAFLVLFVITWLIFKKIKFSSLVYLGAVSILTFLFIGSQMNFINLSRYGNPLGPEETVKQQSGNILISSKAAELTVLNSSRFLYQMADVSGLPDPLWGYGIKLKALIAKPLFKSLNIQVESEAGTYPGHVFSLLRRDPLQEDIAWYGPLGFVILIPFFIYSVFRAIKKKEIYSISAVIFFISYMILIVIFRPGWDPYQGRYFMPIVALLSPFCGFLLGNKKFHNIFGWLFTLIAISTMLSCLLQNPSKPITGDKAVWNKDRIHLLSIQNTYLIDNLKTVNEQLPDDAIVGIGSSGSYYPDYAFFGSHFERTIIPVYPAENLYDSRWIKDNDLEYVVYFKNDDANQIDMPYLKLIIDSDRIQLYKVLSN